MALVTYFCKKAAQLKLGPGESPNDPSTIRFVDSYATLDTEGEFYAKQLTWISGAGAYGIVLVGEADMPRRYDPSDKACPETITTTENLTGSRHEIRGTAPCPFRAPTDREIHQHMLAVHAPKKGKNS
jgi:hypothetical protein